MMRRLALALAAAVAALPALAQDALAQDALPPPPPPPAYEPVPLPPAPDGAARLPAAPGRVVGTRAPARLPSRAGTIGDGPVAPAGAAAASLQPDEAVSPWRMNLASGVLGRFGGFEIDRDRENSKALLYIGAQADGAWTDGYGQAVRLRLRLLAGGEREIFLPSDGELEAAYAIGRPEFRFVAGRVELGRHPGLGIQMLGQLATLPSVEGTLPLAGDTMRLSYLVAPVEMAYVYYYDDAHIDHSALRSSESDEPAAATAARLRYTVLLPPSVLLSLEGDLLKMWKKPDLLVAAEASLGYQVLQQSVLFNLAVRWNAYTRRGQAAGTSETDSELMMLGIATLMF
jgi:hypothetical protein